jgi:hypothetical protein
MRVDTRPTAFSGGLPRRYIRAGPRVAAGNAGCQVHMTRSLILPCIGGRLCLQVGGSTQLAKLSMGKNRRHTPTWKDLR